MHCLCEECPEPMPYAHVMMTEEPDGRVRVKMVRNNVVENSELHLATEAVVEVLGLYNG